MADDGLSQEYVVATTALAMVGLLAGQMREHDLLDAATLRQLRGLAEIADRYMGEDETGHAAGILANLRAGLR